MNKREICERLLFLYERAVRLNSEYKVFEGIRGLILDLAAPEEEPKPETPEAVETAPCVWIDCKAEKRPCPKCGTFSPRSADGDSSTYYCPKCKRYFVDVVGEPKRGEGEE